MHGRVLEEQGHWEESRIPGSYGRENRHPEAVRQALLSREGFTSCTYQLAVVNIRHLAALV